MSPCHARPVSRPRTGPAPGAAWRQWCLGTALLGASALSWAAPPARVPQPSPAASTVAEAAAPASSVVNSALDAPLFYQLLVGEMEAQAGRPGNAFELMLDAARRGNDEGLFRRAIELAVQERSADHALKAVRTWRNIFSNSVEAARTHVQLLLALNQTDGLAQALESLLHMLPDAERAAAIASLPRHLASLPDKARTLELAEQAFTPFLNASATRTAARVSLGELALAAQQPDKALALMRRAHADEPRHPAPMLLALELSRADPGAETLVRSYLQAPDAPITVHLAYARHLERRQRLGESVRHLRLAAQRQPDIPGIWLSLGIQLVDLREPREAVQALETFIQRQSGSAEAAEASARSEENAERAQRSIDLARALLSQAHDQLGDVAAATRWLDQIAPERVDLAILTQRADLLVRQKRVEQALALVRDGQVSGEVDDRARMLAQVHVLREAKRWQAAYDLLLGAVRAAPEDSALIYELAMVAEQLKRHDDMEVLLRQVMRLKPEDAHAYNALGYTLADRNVRLDEALALVQRAVELTPDDPFILDSMGWVAFRQGRHQDALQLLRRAYEARPHAEVGTHLGEVLWTLGQRDEARRIWRDAKAREADNQTLQETLARLKVRL